MVVKQTVPRSGLWLHTFKLSKDATVAKKGPELLNSEPISVEGLKDQLKSVVEDVLLSPNAVQTRKPFHRRWVGI